jgi:hypothetical protein
LKALIRQPSHEIGIKLAPSGAKFPPKKALIILPLLGCAVGNCNIGNRCNPGLDARGVSHQKSEIVAKLEASVKHNGSPPLARRSKKQTVYYSAYMNREISLFFTELTSYCQYMQMNHIAILMPAVVQEKVQSSRKKKKTAA